MQTIYKYEFNIRDDIELVLPQGASFLSVQVQNETPCMWFKVDPSRKKIVRYFRIFGTGHPMEDSFVDKYLGTFQMMGGTLVWHLFEIEKFD
jgi:hypothetical protein